MATHADVVVIGGGAVGLCAAYYLQQAGREVTLLTREPVGIGASAGNAGMIVPSHIVPLSAPGVIARGLRWLLSPESPFYIRPRLDADLARWLWTFRRHCTEAHVARAVPVLRDLSLASTDLLASLQDDIGAVGYAPTGLLMLYRSAKGHKENMALAARAEAAGLTVERLDRTALHAAEPGLKTEAGGGVLYVQDGRVDPDALLRRLAATLQARGADLRQEVTVSRLDARGEESTVAIHASDGLYHAEAVVLAAGAWTGGLVRRLGLRVPVQPAKGYSITVPAPAGCPRLPMILTEDKVTVTPLPGRLRFAGTLALAGFDASVDDRRAAPIRRVAEAYAPGGAGQPAWSGFRPCSPDGLPIVGPVPRHPRVLLATGHGMMGVTLAPITGRLVADHLSGMAPLLDPAPLRPERFG